MSYREEVEEALDHWQAGRNGLVSLILLGVELGLEAAAVRAEELKQGSLGLVSAEIRDIHPGYVLMVKP